MLTKTIYPQKPSRQSSMKCIKDYRPKSKAVKEEEESHDKSCEGSKWVKTDSDCELYSFPCTNLMKSSKYKCD